MSWVAIGDEGSGAHLGAGVINQPTMSKVKAKTVVAVANRCFEQWGLPKCIKIDNGHPLVDPKNRDMPTLAFLWFIGLGIEMIQNQPRSPQQNGIVEGLQGTCASWVNPKGKQSPVELQEALDECSIFQREYYRIPGKQNKTRKELFPELYQNSRRYDPNGFCMQRVEQFLAKKVWTRKVKRSGEIRFRGHYIYLGTKFKAQTVYLTFDPGENQWMVRDERGTLLKTSRKAIIQEQQIKELALNNQAQKLDTT